jgi:hypothetical protein
VASARQNLPGLIRSAAREPQAIYRRGKLVAKVVDPATVERTQPRTLREMLVELQQICAEENYEFPEIVRDKRPRPLFGKRPKAKKRRR